MAISVPARGILADRRRRSLLVSGHAPTPLPAALVGRGKPTRASSSAMPMGRRSPTLFRGRARPSLGGAPPHARRGPTHRGEHGQAATGLYRPHFRYDLNSGTFRRTALTDVMGQRATSNAGIGADSVWRFFPSGRLRLSKRGQLGKRPPIVCARRSRGGSIVPPACDV
jgi:hypothetical protein